MLKTLGGDRLGSGKKMKVHLHNYERSTHDLGYLWRSTMSSGTLVPFMSELALPGDTFDINLNCDIKTHPTVGPLFGSYKVQLDVFVAPIRLYIAELHNNRLGIGMNMAMVKLPQLSLVSVGLPGDTTGLDVDNASINPSCIFSYLGIRGTGFRDAADPTQAMRAFNGVPYLAYWEIYKNYYANKQEEIGAVIHTTPPPIHDTISDFDVFPDLTAPTAETLIEQGGVLNPPIGIINGGSFEITYTGGLGTRPTPETIMVNTDKGRFSLSQIIVGTVTLVGTTGFVATFDAGAYGNLTLLSWQMIQPYEARTVPPNVTVFPLSDIDLMKDAILQNPIGTPFEIRTQGLDPYQLAVGQTTGQNHMAYSQEGLGLKTYQSDLFNNWLQTEWIDGAGGIADITAIDTTSGSFKIDTLVLSKKVYDMLNRIAVSGGSYSDWLDAVYTENKYRVIESPMYMGGLIKELTFQEVVSNAAGGGDQPLGTLAGKGVMSQKHKGGHVVIKCEEPSYIIGIISLTPRIDYSQGNKWDTHILTMDDLHKPALDGIGFQELITEQMAWWSTEWNEASGLWVTRSAGKQPAWINYMTNVNQTRGNFAIANNEMFMTLNRRYEKVFDATAIEDLTTYIDPVKFNHIFAQTSLDAQNFWAQISVDITARRKMSAKIMPNL